ncbi:asparagine synthase-related protein [Streptomyces sp. NPDC052396]|uniref:asparagine synthase-related protein n=1 Tax=Streptomyces sp. NPDC052396 TaxID=3365689 RepID=UPI0037D11C2D
MVGAGKQYFVVLPDDETAAPAAGRLPPDATHILTHRSGRPWVAGRLAEETILVAEHGANRLAVIGQCSATPAQLATAAATIGDPARLDRLGTAWAGSYHLLASVNGRLRVQGTASGLRRVFHGRLGTAVLAADRADILAALLHAPLDPAVLALRLLDALPHPLGDRPAWHNVSAVPPGSHLTLSPDGRGHTVGRWWQAPEPVLSLAEGAGALRAALEEAVRVRTRGTVAVTTDLSGGMDSTSITLLAARERPSLTAFTMENDDQADDDAHWARQAAAAVPGLHHIRYPGRELPLFFGGLAALDDIPDEPSTALLSAPRLHAVREKAVAHGSRLHLDGLGGDQLLSGHPAYHHDLLRSRPVIALNRLRVLHKLAGLPLDASVRTLLDGASYRRWFAAEAGALAAGRTRRPRHVAFDWGGVPGLPGWLTPEAVRLVTRTLRETAGTVSPLAPTRGRHNDLLAIQDAGRMVRQCHQLSDTAGFTRTSPFLDDRVIDACLSVRPERRVTPWEFKPLIKAAMADVLPPTVLTRRTKADGTTIAAEGFERHRRELAELWDTSRLAELGLIDPEPLRRLFRLPYTGRLHEGAAQTALAGELWARAARTATAATGGGQQTRRER